MNKIESTCNGYVVGIGLNVLNIYVMVVLLVGSLL